MKDSLALRPLLNRVERRIQGPLALFVVAATIKAIMIGDLARARVTHSDPPDVVLTTRRALACLGEIRLHRLQVGHAIDDVDRSTPLQGAVLEAVHAGTTGRTRARSRGLDPGATRRGDTLAASLDDEDVRVTLPEAR